MAVLPRPGEKLPDLTNGEHDTKLSVGGRAGERRAAETGAIIRLREGLALTEPASAEMTFHWLRKGALALSGQFPDGRRRLSAFAYPGDVFNLATLRLLPTPACVALLPSEVKRMRLPELMAQEESRDTVIQNLLRGLEAFEARLQINGAALARLSGDERLATFLVEQAHFLGRWSGGTVDIPLPMSRENTADYTGLNPDTLSRLMSRLREQKIVVLDGRSRVVIRDWPGLCAATPLSAALVSLPSLNRPRPEGFGALT